jgi:hypothetical protein
MTDDAMDISPDESRPSAEGPADTFTGPDRSASNRCSIPTPCAPSAQPK